MSDPVFEAVLTLSPANADNRLSFTLNLYPDDSIQMKNGVAKQLKDCTLAELSAFADSLEADVGHLLEQTIGALVAEPAITVLVENAGDDWLDHIVLFESVDSPVTIIEKPDAAVENEIMLTNEPEAAVSAEITVDPTPKKTTTPKKAATKATTRKKAAPKKKTPAKKATTKKAPAKKTKPKPKPVKKAVKKAPVVEDVPIIEDTSENVVEKAAVATEAPPAPPAPIEDIPIEDIPVREAVAVADSEPIHEEKEAAEPATTAEVVAKTPNRTLGVVSERWLNNTVDILVDEEPLRRMQAHASSSLRREVAGVMLGPIPEKQPNNRYIVHVQDIIIAKHTKMRGASVTYTPESWRYLNDVIMERYPNEEMLMLGWYHTHPGFGIFLSGMDIFIHTNFFTQKWHIAYVLDPVGRKTGFFSWDLDQQKVQPFPFIWPDWAAGTW